MHPVVHAAVSVQTSQAERLSSERHLMVPLPAGATLAGIQRSGFPRTFSVSKGDKLRLGGIIPMNDPYAGAPRTRKGPQSL
ncbi:hypothetical protein AAJCM20276_30680 [Acetobacter aceti]|uniref:Uncharacterized protein n=1 Tax=Acetobacter aceti TaxID=435 RepID=A0A6S6PTP5_ACEAC|nr:hypothetical protein AAJCM20276_30680 [Acetobacter aceti]